MTKHSNRLWLAVILLGLVYDFLFWDKPIGVNFAIFMGLSLLTGVGLLIANGQKPAWKSLLLFLPFLFFAVMTFSRQEPLSVFLAFTFTFFTAGVFAVTYLGGRWMRYSLLDYFCQFFELIGSMLARPIRFIAEIRKLVKEQAESGETPKKRSMAPVVRGLLLALPFVACFASLLASADVVFNQKIIDFFDFFEAEKIGEYIQRFLLIIVWAYLLAGVFLHASAKSRDEKLLGEEKPVISPFVGFTESAIVLACVSILFLLFVIVQFRYFFGGNANIGVEGFTYSQYARRGFNELVLVAFFSLLMILGFSTVTKRENAQQRRIYSGLSIAIVVLVLIILVSAYQRLALAIDWHGFSHLRLYPQVSLIWVGILFVGVVVLEVLHQERYFAFAAVLASLGFAVSLCLFNVDDAIVRHNVYRATQGRHFNAPYLATLSIDAVPALVDKFEDKSLPTKVHEGIGAALLCHQNSRAFSEPANGDWRSFNLSRWNARQAFGRVEKFFKKYEVNLETHPIQVRTPGNVVIECAGAEQENEEGE